MSKGESETLVSIAGNAGTPTRCVLRSVILIQEKGLLNPGVRSRLWSRAVSYL
jgi:hypothetical protein